MVLIALCQAPKAAFLKMMNTRNLGFALAWIVILPIVLSGALDYFVRSRLLTPSYLELERQEASAVTMRSLFAFEREISHLRTSVVDWALWDDTYRFLDDMNAEYVTSNMQAETLAGINVDIIYLVTRDGFVAARKLREGRENNLGLEQFFPQGSLPPTHFLLECMARDEEKRGFILEKGGILMISAHPVLTSQGEGPSRGILLMGRFLDQETLATLKEAVGVPVSFVPLVNLTSAGNGEPLSGAARQPIVQPLSETELESSVIVEDLFNTPNLTLKVTMSRDIYQNGMVTSHYVFLVILLFTGGGIALMVILLFFLRHQTERAQQRLEELAVSRQEEAELARQRMQILAEAGFEGVVLIEDGACLLINKRAEEMFGYRSDEVVGQSTTLLIAEDDRDEVAEKIDSAYDQPYEVRGRRKDGQVFPLVIYGRSMCYQGRTIRAAALRDLTLEKQKEAERAVLEAKLWRSQKMESIGLVAGGVAHDLNNILSGLVTYPELLMLDLPQESSLHGPLKAIHSAGKRAAEVVADLLTVARGVAMVIRPESVNQIVTSYLQSPEFKRLQNHHPLVHFSSSLKDGLPNVLGSAAHISKCLMNLVTNGSEAIQGAGRIQIATATCEVGIDQAERLSIVPGQYVRISVQDSGTGISDSDLERIFEPFYSRKVVGRSGTGLGLSIVWNTMQDHKGAVSVESGREGTRFDLYFPPTDMMLEDPAEESLEKLRGHGESILVVDDDPQQLVIADQIFKALGYQVTTAPSGESAVEILRNRQIDLVILDMLMEPGMNGYETFREILVIHPQQKALIASGYSESDDVRRTLDLGAGEFIRKPYSLAQAGQAVRKVIGT